MTSVTTAGDAGKGDSASSTTEMEEMRRGCLGVCCDWRAVDRDRAKVGDTTVGLSIGFCAYSGSLGGTGQCMRDRHGWAPHEVEAVILPRLFLGLWLFLRWGPTWSPRSALRG